MPLRLDRRHLLTALGSSFASAMGTEGLAKASSPESAVTLGPPQPFSFDGLKRHAAHLARRPYSTALPEDEKTLEAIDYDAFVQANYRPDRTLWANTPGAQPVRLFPLGRSFPQSVAIHVLEDGQAKEVIYSLDLFDMPAGHPLRRLRGGGFSGFRLMSRGGESDWLAFLGASYFRASDPFDQYGASARGLAINSGGPAPEEFPRFSAFWLEQDGPHPAGGGGLRVYALLEGPSVVGAYRMDCRREPSGAVQDIEATLYFRAPVESLGLAPLTSMFWYGENTRKVPADWRPQIHDSDGLAIWTGAGERLWRPLDNPSRVLTNAYADALPHGYGLIQRNRAFNSYMDDGLFYEKRPSVWVEVLDSAPASAWTQGAVRLVQLPTAGETDDNIVAFWRPGATIDAGASLAVRYRLNWTTDAPAPAGSGRIVSTRLGPGGRPGFPSVAGAVKFVIDVEGADLQALTRSSGVEAAVTASAGAVSDILAYPVVGTTRWRIMFDVAGIPAEGASLRAYLHRQDQVLSETWVFEAFP